MDNFGLPPAAIKAAESQLIDYYYTPYKKNTMAFVLDKVNGTQLSFELLTEINAFLAKNPLFEICIFTSSVDIPIIFPNTAVYPLAELNQYSGPVVYTEYMGFEYGVQNINLPGVFYIYDPMILAHIHPHLSKEKQEFLKHPGKISYILRDASQKDLLKTILPTHSLPNFPLAIAALIKYFKLSYEPNNY